jgi:hypothetical protein
LAPYVEVIYYADNSHDISLEAVQGNIEVTHNAQTLNMLKALLLLQQQPHVAVQMHPCLRLPTLTADGTHTALPQLSTRSCSLAPAHHKNPGT